MCRLEHVRSQRDQCRQYGARRWCSPLTPESATLLHDAAARSSGLNFLASCHRPLYPAVRRPPYTGHAMGCKGLRSPDLKPGSWTVQVYVESCNLKLGVALGVLMTECVDTCVRALALTCYMFYLGHVWFRGILLNLTHGRTPFWLKHYTSWPRLGYLDVLKLL